jgi:hypothetical protein
VQAGNFPVTVTGTVSDGAEMMAFDGAGNILALSLETPLGLVSITRAGAASETHVMGLSNNSCHALTYAPALDAAIIGCADAKVYSCALGADCTAALLFTVTHEPFALAVAPPSFGSIGGFIVAGGLGQPLAAYNPSTGTPTVLSNTFQVDAATFNATTLFVNDFAGSDGTYAIAADGTTSTLETSELHTGLAATSAMLYSISQTMTDIQSMSVTGTNLTTIYSLPNGQLFSDENTPFLYDGFAGFVFQTTQASGPIVIQYASP